MNMSGESLLLILVVGVIAGWLAGQIVHGTGVGLVGDLIIGVIGAFIGSWLLPQLGVHLGSGIVPAIANATIGAIVLLFLIIAVRGGGRLRWLAAFVARSLTNAFWARALSKWRAPCSSSVPTCPATQRSAGHARAAGV